MIFDGIHGGQNLATIFGMVVVGGGRSGKGRPEARALVGAAACAVAGAAAGVLIPMLSTELCVLGGCSVRLYRGQMLHAGHIAGSHVTRLTPWHPSAPSTDFPRPHVRHATGNSAEGGG